MPLRALCHRPQLVVFKSLMPLRALCRGLQLVVFKPDEDLVPPQERRREGVVVAPEFVASLGLQAVQQQRPAKPPLCLCYLQQCNW